MDACLTQRRSKCMIQVRLISTETKDPDLMEWEEWESTLTISSQCLWEEEEVWEAWEVWEEWVAIHSFLLLVEEVVRDSSSGWVDIYA